jgi:protein-L-isoaspartate(D-aspartate) O-methyltransferase
MGRSLQGEKMSFRTLNFALLVVGLAVAAAEAQSLRDWRQQANRMVDQEIVAAGVTNPRVIQAMRDTPRHEFVPQNQRQYAYYDMALPIGYEQTISPPFVVAYMTQELDPQPGDRVLEIGTGSGYQAAVLSRLVRDVYTIEIVEPLGRRAARTLKRLGYSNVSVKVGDGFQGWPDAAPFDKIIVTCSPEEVPQPLVEQLRDGGRMIVPVGERYQQNLYLFRKENGKLVSEALRATLFVPMTGEAEEQRRVQPDPLHPEIFNGGFEEVVESQELADENQNSESGTPSTKRESPAGWHYQRQLTLENDPDHAPQGERFVTFHNEEPGRSCHALQGFAVDGRKVSKMKLSYSIRGEDIRRGQQPDSWPLIVITFYNDDRAMIGNATVGPFFGSFDWRHEVHEIDVPLKANEAIIRIGLLGAVGTLSLDDLQLAAVR